ncbi:hypothetical protein PG994_010080 [Apiospora phragmitis]|uniref:Uncharacterized protein n=1 Tax=Apiospora phragmitis TaxID=2905665 RepID=A0ABR1TR45_9PEZI
MPRPNKGYMLKGKEPRGRRDANAKLGREEVLGKILGSLYTAAKKISAGFNSMGKRRLFQQIMFRG